MDFSEMHQDLPGRFFEYLQSPGSLESHREYRRSKAGSISFRLKTLKADISKIASTDRGGGLLLFALFISLGLAITFKSLTYDWFWDDLHLVRTYSGAELIQAFTGNWDPDNIETPGYRPMTTVFNHIRGSLFGENVVMQRLLMIALFAGYLSILGLVARRLGIPIWQAAIAGSISLAARYNLWNLVWISDGVHAFAGLFFILGVYWFARHMEQPAIWRFFVSLVCVGIALLTREETLSLLPVIPAFAFVYSALSGLSLAGVSIDQLIGLIFQRQFSILPALFPRSFIKSILRYCAVLALMTVGYWILRTSFVEGPPKTLQLQGWRLLIQLTIFPMGRNFQERSWWLMLASLATIAVFMLSSKAKLQAGFWLGCMFISTSIGLVLARVNLLFFPISFFGLFLAVVIGEFSRNSRSASVYSLVFLVVLLVWSARLNLIQQESVHPLSIQYLEHNGEYIWGTFPRLTIPEKRRERMIQYYEVFGIHSADEFSSALPTLREQADMNGRDRPDKEGNLFIPRIDILAP